MKSIILLFYICILVTICKANDRQYYPRTKGLPWAKRQVRDIIAPPGSEVDKSDFVGSYGQFYSIQNEGKMPDLPAVQLIALIKRSCSGSNKGPRHLYVTMCG